MGKISELTTLALKDVEPYSDYLPIVDDSTGTVKRINVANLQGYTSNATTALDITSLCTSDYTVSSAIVYPLSGREAMVDVTIHNGTTGIPVSALGTSENLLSLPHTIIGRSHSILETLVLTEVPPTAAWALSACLPLYLPYNATTTVKRSATNFDGNSFVPEIAKFSNGNLKAIRLRILVTRLYNQPELPYNS